MLSHHATKTVVIYASEVFKNAIEFKYLKYAAYIKVPS